MLSLSNISFSYESPILKGVSLDLTPGKTYGLIGENGSGKSTLLKCIDGQLDLENGIITLNGDRIQGPSEKHIPGIPEIKLVSQNSKVHTYMSVMENLETCFLEQSSKYIEARSNDLLERFGLIQFKDLRANELSGGQRQRLALAISIAEPPAILLLDEPFSQIDPHSSFVLMKELCNEGLTILCVSHHPNLLFSFTDHVFALANGQISQEGSMQQIYNQPVNTTIAKLTGLFSEINGQIRRPESLSIIKGDKYTVKQSHPVLNGYIIELKGDVTIYVRNNTPLETGELYNVQIND